MSFRIEPISEKDHNRIKTIISKLWGDDTLAVHGELFHTAYLDGFKAIEDGEIIGILHYQLRGSECEILTLASLQEGQGVGTALIATLEGLAKINGCRKLSLITTNDNLHALRFYQRRGFQLTALYPHQVEQSRKLKPVIPMIGDYGIPIRDEILLEKDLSKDHDDVEC
jgi:GNAT superfamily N-acetyltransferase